VSRLSVAAAGARLSARVDGAADRPWLLLSNSLASDLSMWDDQIGLLTRTHRVVRYDSRGHGQSEAPEGPYDFAMLVADMVAVLDHVGADRADVMGLSLGGMTALGLGLGHPDRVARLAVCAARADAPPAFVAAWDDRLAAVAAGGMQAILAGTLSRWFTPACPAGVLARATAMILNTPPRGYAGCARALQRLDYLPHLGRMQPPVLYLVGAEDPGAPQETVAAMAAATPGAGLVVLPGLAHVPNMEDPAAFAAAIDGWLRAAA
jgi:3-oxoadipate enol-lactonase